MNKIQRKWWFITPVAVLTVASSFWLFWALGLEYPGKVHSWPGIVLLVISLLSTPLRAPRLVGVAVVFTHSHRREVPQFLTCVGAVKR